MASVVELRKILEGCAATLENLERSRGALDGKLREHAKFTANIAKQIKARTAGHKGSRRPGGRKRTA